MPPAVALGLMAAQAGLQAKAAHDQAKSEEAILKYNAKVAEQGAEAVKASAAEEQAQMRDRMVRTLARNEVITAGSGLQMAGTPLDAQLSVMADAAHDIATVGYNADIEARRHRTQAQAFRLQAEAARQTGKLGVAGALVGGVGDMTSFYAQQKLADQGLPKRKTGAGTYAKGYSATATPGAGRF